MDAQLYSLLAQLVLAVHVAIILFNVAGLVLIPLGGWRGWSFVRIFWWRALHLAILALVAVQALLARACFSRCGRAPCSSARARARRVRR